MVYFTSLFTFIHSFNLIFCYFTWCISHVSLIIISNKIFVFIHLKAATGKSPAK